MLQVLGQMPRHAAVDADGAGMTFLVMRLGPKQIHRERLGEIVSPILLFLKPGCPGLGFVIATEATIVLHFIHSLGTWNWHSVYKAAQTATGALMVGWYR